MTEIQQLEALKKVLEPLTRQYGGSVHVAHDQLHLFKILGETPGAPRWGLYLAGETPRNADRADIEVRLDRKFWVCLSRGYDLESYPGKSLTEGIAGGSPLFEILRATKLALRGQIIGTPDEPVPYYLGYEVFTFEGMKLDAYKLTLTIATDDLTDPVSEPDPNADTL